MCFDLSGEELGAGGVSVRAEEERGEEEGVEDRFANFKTRRVLCVKMARVPSDDEATVLLQCPGDVATSSFKILKSVRIWSFLRSQKYNEFEDWIERYLCPSKPKG